MTTDQISSPSPVPDSEIDLTAHSRDWSDDQATPKGKGKQREILHPEPDPTASSESLPDVAYPPMTDDDAETRRIEENLRRWEVAERQRRKAARESTTEPQTSSIVSDVGRRASLLWNGRPSTSRPYKDHAALESRESLDTMAMSPIPPTEDPFSNPTSPFADSQAAVMDPSDLPPSLDEPTPSTSLAADAPQRPAMLLAKSSSFSRPPPPMPLGLPPPRRPPSLDELPLPDEEQPVRWWHEWLCGCGEGRDRGGDIQAGRTNPYE